MPPNPTAKLAALLAAGRDHSGLSLRDIERETGIPRSSLSLFFNGRAAPRYDQLLDLAALFGTTATALVAQAEDADEPSAA